MFLRAKLINKSTFAVVKNVRSFLSDAFKCQSGWDSRLQAPFMQNVTLDMLYYNIKQGSSKEDGKMNAIDVDIFVNKVSAEDEVHVDEMNELLYALRRTSETSSTLESTHHAVVRNYTDLGHENDLIKVLDNRLSYGIFLDHYSASYLLDHLIKKKDFRSGARVACFLMLQEDLDNELSRTLSLYACYKYLNTREPFYPVEEKKEADEEPEVVKVRVKFLRNEFFDDHFDIKNHEHLVGKTLIAIGKRLESPLATNIKLLGYILYAKYEDALKELQQNDGVFYKEILEHCKNTVDGIVSESVNLESVKTALQECLSNQNRLQQNSLDAVLEEYCKSMVSKHEATEIEKQQATYVKWNQQRETILKSEQQRLDRVKRLKNVEDIVEKMKTKEQHLWFFEKEDLIDLQIDSKKVTYPKRWFGKKKVPRAVDKDYIPPEIQKGRIQ